MATNWFEVPENETWKGDVGGLLVAALAMGENALKTVQSGTFTGAIRGPGGVEKRGVSWYNFDSRRTNLSIRYFNHLKSIRGRSPEAGLGRVFGVIFKHYPAQFSEKVGAFSRGAEWPPKRSILPSSKLKQKTEM